MTERPGINGFDRNSCTATLLDEADEQHQLLLDRLRTDPGVEFLDTRDQQRDTLGRLCPPVGTELRDEPHRWAYYPWRRTVVGVLGPQSFRTLRFDRNRNLVTDEEQARLGQLRVGVVGLSVGHAVAHTLALQGVAGHLRLADFDHLELSNLNRVPATVLDLGVNKATVAARRIAELDPYLKVDVIPDGLSTETIEKFLDGLDVVVEECDSLDMKVLVREAARARRIPVLMSTSDRGMVDVERFDLEPTRPILHGLLQGVDSEQLAGLSSVDKIPHMLRFLDVSRTSTRAAASMIEVNSTLTTWPQLAGEVVLGATSIVEAVRRIGLGEPLPSGRTRIDIAAALTAPEQPQVSDGPPQALQGSEAQDSTHVADLVAAAANRAPSAGNSQPWRITAAAGTVTIAIDPALTSALDIGFRASAVAVGAATFNARVAAAAHDAVGAVVMSETDCSSPLLATITLGSGTAPDLARLYRPMLTRETNRRNAEPASIDRSTFEVLQQAADNEGARLQLITDRDDIHSVAGILARTDRIRYLTPRLHAEMLEEIRWPDDPNPITGIELRSLELGDDEVSALDILKRPEVMAHLAEWRAGTSLGDNTRDRVGASSALGVLTVNGRTLTDFARGGGAAEATWIAANQQSLAVHPVSPLFLYAHDDEELDELSPEFSPELRALRQEFCEVARTTSDETLILVMRFTSSPPASLRSRRRGLQLVRQTAMG